MAFYIPILGAVALATGTIFEKIILRNKKMSIKLYQVITFLMVSISIIPLAYFFWELNPEAFQTKNILIYIGVIISALIANFLFYFSLKWEKVTNTEPARMLEPFFTILLAVIFSLVISKELYESNIKILIPALIAASALVFSNLRRNHLKINKYILAAIFASFFFALELILSRLILDYYSPFTFYFLRCASVFIISLIIFRPKFSILKEIDKRTKLLVFLTALVWIVFRVVVYYGYLTYGVIFTTLMVMLGPVLIYLFAGIFLKEKISFRNLIAGAIILGCILYAIGA